MTAPDPFAPLPAGECWVFRTDYSLELLADGPTPWGDLRVVPGLEPRHRRADWLLGDTLVASLRMPDPEFGGRLLSASDYPVVIDPLHPAEFVVGSRTSTVSLVDSPRRGLRRRGTAFLATELAGQTWSFRAGKTYEGHVGAGTDGEPAVTVRNHAVQDATRPDTDRTDDWRFTHLLRWTDGVPLAGVALGHLLFAATNYAVTGSRMASASADTARKSHFDNRSRLLGGPGQS
jgi:hypothetical protein